MDSTYFEESEIGTTKLKWEVEARDIVKSIDEFVPYLERLGLTSDEIDMAKRGVRNKSLKIPRMYLEDILSSIDCERTRIQVKNFLVPFPEERIAHIVPDTITFLDNRTLDNNPVKGLTRMYVDRVLFSPVHTCSIHCDWCFRDMASGTLTESEISDVINYIKKDKRIKDVIVTGGEPLLLSDERLAYLLERIREIDHVDIIRFHTRIIVSIPSRISSHFIDVIRNFQAKGKPIYFVTQFIHPVELTDRATDAVYALVSNGFIVFNQAPILRGVNDDQETFNSWIRKMIKYQIKPYYAISTIIKDGMNSRFFVPFDEVVKLVNNYAAKFDGLGRPTVIVPVMGRKLTPDELLVGMGTRGAHVRNTKSEIWKGTR